MKGLAEPVSFTSASRSGLSDSEALRRLHELGRNAIPEARKHAVLAFLGKLWAPVPWMLEATLVLELVLGHRTQAAIVTVLLLLNAILSAIEEGRARNALDLLRARLALHARVRRDGRWRAIPAEELVAGDLVYLRMGDLVPADVKLIEGQLLADHSALTGESLPVDVAPGSNTYSGALVRRGEGLGEVTAIGARSYFGKTAQLVRLARARGRFEELVLRIVRALVAVDVLLVLAVVGYALAVGIPLAEIAPFALMVLVASVPVALPATFTLATALGSLELAKHGVLVTRLSAVEDAAAMDVLCTDKTGTITKNELRVTATHAVAGRTEDEVLRFAALASRAATEDPIDAAILAAAHERGLLAHAPERLRFVPFDPALKRSEAFYRDGEAELHVVKGAPNVIAPLDPRADMRGAAERLSERGERVIGVAAGTERKLALVGFVTLADPPREGTKHVIERLRELGIRVLMVTGDALPTARAVAAAVGIGSRAVPREAIADLKECPYLTANAFAGVFPEDKIHLVQALQRDGHVVGMTGDGVNDAPALKQAEVGIAVANATDVAKGAASLVLTRPGLEEILPAIETSRRVYQRLLTYTLNKVVKTFHVALLLGVGFLVTGVIVTTPRLILLLLLANDFVTMSIASDRVVASRHPDEWNVRALVGSALALAVGWLAFSTSVVLLGLYAWRLVLPALQTLVFLALVFASQATVFLVRERRRFWSSRPAAWLALGAVVAVGSASFLAIEGVLMTPVPAGCVASVFALTLVAVLVLDALKVAVFVRLGVTERVVKCS